MQSAGRLLGDHSAALTTLGALLASVGFVATAVAAFAALRQARIGANQLSLQTKVANWTSSRECVWHFTREWNFELRPVWERVNKHLESEKPKRWWRFRADLRASMDLEKDFDALLNHFDAMAYLGMRGHLDDGLAWSLFYENVKHYWTKACDLGYVDRVRERDPTLWMEIDPWIDKLYRIDATKQHEALSKRRPRGWPSEARDRIADLPDPFTQA